MAKLEKVRDGYLGDLPENLQKRVMEVHKIIKKNIDEMIDLPAYDDLTKSSWAMSCIDEFSVMPKDKTEIGSFRVYRDGKKKYRTMVQVTGHFTNHRYGWIEELLHDFMCNVFSASRPAVRKKFDNAMVNESDHGDSYEGFDLYFTNKESMELWNQMEGRTTKSIKEDTEFEDDFEEDTDFGDIQEFNEMKSAMQYHLADFKKRFNYSNGYITYEGRRIRCDINFSDKYMRLKDGTPLDRDSDSKTTCVCPYDVKTDPNTGKEKITEWQIVITPEIFRIPGNHARRDAIIYHEIGHLVNQADTLAAKAQADRNNGERHTIMDYIARYTVSGNPHAVPDEFEADRYAANRTSDADLMRGLTKSYRNVKKTVKKAYRDDPEAYHNWQASVAEDVSARRKALKDPIMASSAYLKPGNKSDDPRNTAKAAQYAKAAKDEKKRREAAEEAERMRRVDQTRLEYLSSNNDALKRLLTTSNTFLQQLPMKIANINNNNADTNTLQQDLNTILRKTRKSITQSNWVYDKYNYAPLSDESKQLSQSIIDLVKQIKAILGKIKSQLESIKDAPNDSIDPGLMIINIDLTLREKIKSHQDGSIVESFTYTEATQMTPEYKEAKNTLRTIGQRLINDVAASKGFKMSQYNANLIANIITRDLLPVWAGGYRKLSITLTDYNGSNTLEFKVPKMTQDFVARFVVGRESMNGFLHRQPEIKIKISPRIFHQIKDPDDLYNFFKSAVTYYDTKVDKAAQKLMHEAMKLNHTMKQLVGSTSLCGIVTYPLSLLFIFDDVKITSKTSFELSASDVNAVSKFIKNIPSKYAAPAKEKKKIVDDIKEVIKVLRESCDDNDTVNSLRNFHEEVSAWYFDNKYAEMMQDINDRWIDEQVDYDGMRKNPDPEAKYLCEAFGVKKLKKIPRDLIAYIQIETEAIKDANDKMMISSYCLSKLEIVEWYIELIDVGTKKYIVPHPRTYLEALRTQLLACHKKIMETPIPKADRPLINVQYPAGYEG